MQPLAEKRAEENNTKKGHELEKHGDETKVESKNIETNEKQSFNMDSSNMSAEESVKCVAGKGTDNEAEREKREAGEVKTVRTKTKGDFAKLKLCCQILCMRLRCCPKGLPAAFCIGWALGGFARIPGPTIWEDLPLLPIPIPHCSY